MVSTLCTVFTLASAGPAQANGEFRFGGCWGKVLGGYGFCGSYPWAANIEEVSGSGENHSVCVGVQSVGSRMCSSGPLQGVYNFTPEGHFGFPYIENNAAGSNKVYAVANWVNPPPAEGGGGCGCKDPYRYMLGTSNGAGIGSWSQILSGMSNATMKVGDLTGDGKADIVAAESEGNGKDRYMLGVSNGAGISSWSQILSGMSVPIGFAVGDLTGDGKADIVAIESEGNGNDRFMLGTSNGAGISSWSQIMSGMSQPTQFGLGDLTGDGKADIVSVEHAGTSYRYMLGVSNGAGISSWSQILGGMGNPTVMRVGDLTGDGKADIVSVENAGTSYRYMLGVSNGAGISSWSQILSGMANPRQMRVGDLTGDGKADIVAAESEGNGNDRFMLGTSNGAGIASWNTIMSGMEDPTQFGLGDVTGDGKAADIVSMESYTE
jgi:FG-GAP-like repeat